MRSYLSIPVNDNTVLSFTDISTNKLLTLASHVERRDNIACNMTNDESVSDISWSSFVSAILKRPRQWTFQDWMTEEPVKIYYDKNNDPHPLYQFPVKVGGAKN